jgi:hypothetical protein
MGGTVGEVQGKSKIEAYARYVDLVENVGDTFGDRYPDPVYKKFTKRQMEQDPEPGNGSWPTTYIRRRLIRFPGDGGLPCKHFGSGRQTKSKGRAARELRPLEGVS